MSVHDGQPSEKWETGMRLHSGEDWKVHGDPLYDDDGNVAGRWHQATLRRVGWLDQKGRVWLETPPGAQFDGGSLTPLLIDSRED